MASVLIVDDSLTVRMDLAEKLAAAGMRAIPCASATEARSAALQEDVRVVVLDVILPDGDGIELLRELRDARRGSLRVLLLSSEADVRDRIRGLERGADEYVGKPYDAAYVVARVRELLRERTEEPASSRASVLVVDDSVTFREELRSALSKAGYDVLVAESGEEGLAVAARETPRAVVVDGQLPGIDGATVIRRIRLDAALRRTPCVLLTASANVDVELNALDAGADAFVRKSEDVDVILARLGAVLRSAAIEHEVTESVLGPKKIVAVDDSETYLQSIADVLRGEGYDVVLARSGEEAIDLLSVQRVDCILLDLVMPGMSGREACRRIKNAPALRDIPLIMLTALEDRSSMIEGLLDGADDYIPKSSAFEVLRARVRALLRRRQFEEENRRIRERLLQSELEASQAKAARELAETRAALVEELEYKNHELDAFNHSVSHDLRSPLRAIEGFTDALAAQHAHQLDDQGRRYLGFVQASAKRMAQLIEDLLALSRVGRAPVERATIDVTSIASKVAEELARTSDREVEFVIEPGLVAEADAGLVRIVFDNLLGNAFKFTSRVLRARIEVGRAEDPPSFFVRDNGAGFDLEHADRLFAPFQRLHSAEQFPGTGVGLATVQRIVSRHGGRIWADAEVNKGATFYFTLTPWRRT